ncbi:hypothetical protein BIW11_12140, partial [Tropilaelaps mercedesae]
RFSPISWQRRSFYLYLACVFLANLKSLGSEPRKPAETSKAEPGLISCTCISSDIMEHTLLTVEMLDEFRLIEQRQRRITMKDKGTSGLLLGPTLEGLIGRPIQLGLNE